MTKFKVGDKVRVRSWESMEKEFGTDCRGEILCCYTFTTEMKKYCGKTFTITRAYKSLGDKDCYNFDSIPYAFSNDMLEAATNFKVGQKYRVGSDGLEEGNIIKITCVDTDHVCYRTIVGNWPSSSFFEPDSTFARSLTPVVDDKIIIMTDGVTTTAKRISDGKTATAKCSPEDKFDFNLGATIALSRLTGFEKKVEKPKFKVGEFVKVISESYCHHFPIGSIVKIETISNNYVTCYGLEKNSYGDYVFGTQTLKLESVEKL